jgi:hypothetical protein
MMLRSLIRFDQSIESFVSDGRGGGGGGGRPAAVFSLM